jgi:hypothetical protein
MLSDERVRRAQATRWWFCHLQGVHPLMSILVKMRGVKGNKRVGGWKIISVIKSL